MPSLDPQQDKVDALEENEHPAQGKRHRKHVAQRGTENAHRQAFQRNVYAYERGKCCSHREEKTHGKNSNEYERHLPCSIRLFILVVLLDISDN